MTRIIVKAEVTDFLHCLQAWESVASQGGVFLPMQDTEIVRCDGK